VPDDSFEGPKHVAFIDDIIKNVLCFTVIYTPILPNKEFRKYSEKPWRKWGEELKETSKQNCVLSYPDAITHVIRTEFNKYNKIREFGTSHQKQNTA